MLPISMTGTIQSMIKTQQLQMKWQMRKADPKMEKGTKEERQIARFYEDAERMRESNVISTIDGKLQAGQKITDEELEYLRVNSPDLYKKAVEAAMEREQYKKALEKCRTKEDVERLNSNKMQGFLSETKAIRGNPNIPQGKKLDLLKQITRRMMGVQSEHIVFTSKSQYANMPREAELEEGKKKRKEKPVEVPELGSKPDKPHPEQKPEESKPGSGRDSSVNGDASPETSTNPYKTEITPATPVQGAVVKYAAAVAKSLPESTASAVKSSTPSSAAVKAPISIATRA